MPLLERRHRPRTGRGQALVEFALIFPLFIVLLLAIIEFMFLFNAQLSLNYATRDATLIAAEAGNNENADCQILRQIDNDLNAPTDESRVLTVHIFSATETGDQLSTPKEQTYTRGGTTTCGSLVVPYTLGTNDYPYNVRCNDLDRTTCASGFTGPDNTGVDIIGVQLDYGYRFVTPLSGAFALLGGVPLWGGAGISMNVANAMRMEPIL
ncbi:MAG: pilus assembly protein [Chloroflexi bacterium]|nr:pilus assembly protein [Chloroflexota bacterium]